jgi:hypothetical protein
MERGVRNIQREGIAQRREGSWVNMTVTDAFSKMANKMGSGMAVCQQCAEWLDVGVTSVHD